MLASFASLTLSDSDICDTKYGIKMSQEFPTVSLEVSALYHV